MFNYETLSHRFVRFAENECQQSPLYYALATRVAGDEALLEIAGHGTSGPKPSLFLAAVHYLLLDRAVHPLAAYYPTVSGQVSDTGDVFPDFRDFCLEHAADIHRLMETRLVQTNEVRRSAILMPVMQLIQEREQGVPLSLIEVGASAGLLLLLDQYCLDYGEHGQFGQQDSALQLTCEVRGKQSPPLSEQPLTIAERTGIDLNPVDVTDPDEALWLQALVWADQPERLERLRQAIAIVSARPPRLVAGDALEELPPVLAATDPNATLCVFHCHTLNQFTTEGRDRFAQILADASRERVVYEIALESYASAARPELTLTIFRDGKLADQRVVAHYDPHGAWIEWL